MRSLFDSNDSKFISFIQKIEQKTQELIFEKKDVWFHNNLDMDDIESLFISPLRIYKGNKYLLRCQIQNSKLSQKHKTIQIFDENEKEREISDINNESKIISIIDIQGIKFSSTSFQFHIILRQCMLLNNEPMFNKCLISRNKNNAIPSDDSINNNSIVSESFNNEEIENNKDDKLDIEQTKQLK